MVHQPRRKQKQHQPVTFPEIDVDSATNEALVDELRRTAGWMDFTTTTAQSMFYEGYEARLKAAVLARMK